MADITEVANAIDAVAVATIGGDLATIDGYPLLKMGTLPDEAEDKFPSATFRLSTPGGGDNFGICDEYWIFNIYASEALASAVIAKKLKEVFRNAYHFENGIGFNTQARVLQQVPEKGAVNTPVEIRVTTI